VALGSLEAQVMDALWAAGEPLTVREVLRLALMLADIVAADANTGYDHPMVMAARWVQAGYSADAAVRWVTAGAAWDPPLSPGVETATMDP